MRVLARFLPSPANHIYAVVNQKGGVGKTTTAVNVAACLAQAGKKTLLIDADPQSNATSGVGVDKAAITGSLYDVLVEGASVKSVVMAGVAGITGLDLVPSTLDLSGAETALYSEQNFTREQVLKSALKEVAGQYDFILIDAPPSLGLLAINILVASTRLIIPIQCEYYALEGISQLLTVVEQIKKSMNPRLEIAKVVLTMQDARVNISQQVAEEVRTFFGARVADVSIPRNVRLSEAPSYGQPISIFDQKSRGAAAYQALAIELMELK